MSCCVLSDEVELPGDGGAAVASDGRAAQRRRRATTASWFARRLVALLAPPSRVDRNIVLPTHAAPRPAAGGIMPQPSLSPLGIPIGSPARSRRVVESSTGAQAGRISRARSRLVLRTADVCWQESSDQSRLQGLPGRVRQPRKGDGKETESRGSAGASRAFWRQSAHLDVARTQRWSAPEYFGLHW